VVVLVNTTEAELPLDGELGRAEVLVASCPAAPGAIPADGALWLRRP
jgi:hypothetical protein